MNTWNSKFVRASYDKQAMGFITNVNGKIQLQHPTVGTEIRRLVTEEGFPANSPDTIERANKAFRDQPSSITSQKGPTYTQPLFGYVIKWLSELGRAAELEAFLAHADQRFNPTWKSGGLFYPRNDQIVDDNLEWTFVDPFSGNAAIGYARLNVQDGQKKMWDQPWTREDVASRPWVDGIDFSQGVDCLRGHYDREVVIITLKSWNKKRNSIAFSVNNLDSGDWALYERGKLVGVHRFSDKGGSVDVVGVVDIDEELDYVIMKHC